MDCIVHGVAKSWTRLSDFYFTAQFGRHFSFCSVQFSSVAQEFAMGSLRLHGLQHARPPCPSPTPGVYSNSQPLSRWCHPTISSSVSLFCSCLQSFPASGSFQMSQFFASGFLYSVPNILIKEMWFWTGHCGEMVCGSLRTSVTLHLGVGCDLPFRWEQISHFEWHWYISSYSLCLTNIDSNPHNKTRYYCFPHFTDGDLDVGSRMNSPRFLLLVSGWTGFEHRQMALQTHTHAYTYIHAFIKYKLLTPGKHCPSCKFVYLFVYTLPFPWKYLRQFTRMYKTWQKNLKRERSSDCSFLYLPQEGSIVLESTCMRPNSLQFCPTLRPHGL